MGRSQILGKPIFGYSGWDWLKPEGNLGLWRHRENRMHRQVER